MTAPLFFVSADRLAGAAQGSVIVLDGSEGRHGATVKRIGVGEQVLLTDGAGHHVDAVVESVGTGELCLRLARDDAGTATVDSVCADSGTGQGRS